MEQRFLQRERILSQEKPLALCQPKEETLSLSTFVQTTPYQQFVELCEDCRRFRYVGISYGLPGVGKTLAARLYAAWDAVEPLLTRSGVRQPVAGEQRFFPRVAYYTPGRTIKPKQIENDIAMLFWSLHHLEKIALRQLELVEEVEEPVAEQVELVILDNVHRLDPVCMDVVQDLYDRYQIGVVLLGNETLVQKHLVRLHHLRVRVGEVRPFMALSRKEVVEMMTQMLLPLQLEMQAPSGLSLEQLTEEIYEVTQGNVSLLRHFLTQIVLLLQKKQSKVITSVIVQQAYARLRLT